MFGNFLVILNDFENCVPKTNISLSLSYLSEFERIVFFALFSCKSATNALSNSPETYFGLQRRRRREREKKEERERRRERKREIRKREKKEKKKKQEKKEREKSSRQPRNPPET
jgi:hypothetical protein